MGLRVILTGATGLVGEGVLLECLENPAVERVLVVGRRACGREHAKLGELLVPDFNKLEAIEAQLAGYDTSFYCAGISSADMSGADYTRITYDTPLHLAGVLARLNPQMVLCHVSGAHADGFRPLAARPAAAQGPEGRPGPAAFGSGGLHQRFSSRLLLYPHFHAVFPDGAFAEDAAGKLVVHALRASQEHVEGIVARIARKAARLARLDLDSMMPASLDRLRAQAAQGELALEVGAVERGTPGLVSRAGGFSPQAARHLHAQDREGLASSSATTCGPRSRWRG